MTASSVRALHPPASGPDELEPVLVEELHRALVDRLRHPAAPPARSLVAALVRERLPLAGPRTAAALLERVLARVEGLGALEPLLADAAVSEVMINGAGPVFVEREGRIEQTGVLVDEPAIRQLIERIVAPLGRRVDQTSPSVDARLPDGSRVHAIVPPVAVDGPCLTIRRFRVREVTLEEFAPVPVAELLRRAVADRRSIVVSGGTGAGKTTLLNALAGALPAGERVITVEDAAELRLPIGHVVRLEARPASSDGTGEVTIRDLVRAALRMRPDRIVVGEVRGGEALDMVQAMTTGHDGSLSTCHANAPLDALRRLETMVLLAGTGLPAAAVREQLASAVDLVVQVARGGDGRRTVVEVVEVQGVRGGAYVLRPVADARGLVTPQPVLAPDAGRLA